MQPPGTLANSHLTPDSLQRAQRSCVSWLPSTRPDPLAPVSQAPLSPHQTHWAGAAKKSSGPPLTRGRAQPTSYTIGPESGTSHLGPVAGQAPSPLPQLICLETRPLLALSPPWSPWGWSTSPWAYSVPIPMSTEPCTADFFLSAAIHQLRDHPGAPGPGTSLTQQGWVTSLPLVPLSLNQNSRESGALTGEPNQRSIPEKGRLGINIWSALMWDRKGMCPCPQYGQNWNPWRVKPRGLDVNSMCSRVSGNQSCSQSEHPTSQGHGTPAKCQRHSAPSLFERSIRIYL